MFEFIVFQVYFLRFNVLKMIEFWFFEVKHVVPRSKWKFWFLGRILQFGQNQNQKVYFFSNFLSHH